MSVIPQTAGIDTSFISFNSASRLVSWYTADNSYAGVYTVKIIGTIDAASTWT
jgi:hypothetical protein